MTIHRSLFTMLSFAPLAAAACSGPSSGLVWSNGQTGEHAPESSDAGASDAASSGPASVTPSPIYPAPHAPMPVVDYGGGPLLTSPRVVTVTVAGDPMESDLQRFGDVITQTSWWQQVTDGYCAEPGRSPCIGAGQGGGHVVLPSLPSTALTDAIDPSSSSSIKSLLRAKIGDGTMPAPTPQTLYVLYVPHEVTVSIEMMRSCIPGGFYGFHNAMTVTAADGGVVPVYYAVVMRCTGAEAEVTRTASHEIVEAATDPSVIDAPGYSMTASPWAWGGGEVGDVCVDYTGGTGDTVLESGFVVQRSWSNKAALAGGDPCVPAPAGQAYFNVAPAAGSEKLALAMNESRTIELDAYADAPTPNWTLDVADFAALAGDEPYLRVHYDTNAVNNGSKVNLTLTLVAPIPPGVSAPYAIVSRGHGVVHAWFAEVTQR